MTASELAAARARLGLTPDELAAELGLTPHSYAACEAGRATLPRRAAQLVAFRVACAERDDALAASGLPACEWMERWDREGPPAGARPGALVAHLERAERHAEACATCEARERFVRERFPEMPEPPVPGSMRLLGAAIAWIDARPAWTRPALYGAALLAGMTTFRALFMLLGAGREPRLVGGAVVAVLAAAAAGAGGGLVYSFLGRPLRRVPVAGPYLAGVVAVAGYLACILGLMAAAGEEVADGGVAGSLAAFGVASVVLGLVVGHLMLRPRAGGG